MLALGLRLGLGLGLRLGVRLSLCLGLGFMRVYEVPDHPRGVRPSTESKFASPIGIIQKTVWFYSAKTSKTTYDFLF